MEVLALHKSKEYQQLVDTKDSVALEDYNWQVYETIQQKNDQTPKKRTQSREKLPLARKNSYQTRVVLDDRDPSSLEKAFEQMDGEIEAEGGSYYQRENDYA